MNKYSLNFGYGFSKEQKEKDENLNSVYDNLLILSNLCLEYKLINKENYLKLIEEIGENYQKQKAVIFLEPKINDLRLKANSIITKGLESVVKGI